MRAIPSAQRKLIVLFRRLINSDTDNVSGGITNAVMSSSSISLFEQAVLRPSRSAWIARDWREGKSSSASTRARNSIARELQKAGRTKRMSPVRRSSRAEQNDRDTHPPPIADAFRWRSFEWSFQFAARPKWPDGGIHFSLAPFDLSRSPAPPPRPPVVLAPSRGSLSPGMPSFFPLPPRIFRVRPRRAVNGEQKALGAHAPAFSLSFSSPLRSSLRRGSSRFPYHRHREIAGRHLSFASPGWIRGPAVVPFRQTIEKRERIWSKGKAYSHTHKRRREPFAVKLRDAWNKRYGMDIADIRMDIRRTLMNCLARGLLNFRHISEDNTFISY